MSAKRYLHENALSGLMEVTELIPDERPMARFRETWFHPQGGGQKGDRGMIASVPVLDVRHAPEGAVDHLVASLDGLEVGGVYPFTVDTAWRRLNSTFHTAAHLLVGVCERMFPGVAVAGGHQWPGEARVDFAGEGLQRVIERSGELELAVRGEISTGLPVAIVGGPYTDRACRIGDYPPIPCSGTHVSTTSDLGQFKLRSAKLKRGQLRLGYEVLDS